MFFLKFGFSNRCKLIQLLCSAVNASYESRCDNERLRCFVMMTMAWWCDDAYTFTTSPSKQPNQHQPPSDPETTHHKTSRELSAKRHSPVQLNPSIIRSWHQNSIRLSRLLALYLLCTPSTRTRTGTRYQVQVQYPGCTSIFSVSIYVQYR